MRRIVAGLGMLVAGMLAAGSAWAQTPGTSTSSLTANGCSPQTATGSATSLSCSGPSTSSNNATRTLSAIAEFPSGGYLFASASSTQHGALTVVGTPTGGDALVLHFLTTYSLDRGTTLMGNEVPGGFSLPYANWVFSASIVGGSGSATGSFQRNTITPLSFTDFTQTAAGFDMTVPLFAGDPVLPYDLTTTGNVFGGDVGGVPVGASVTATLAGIDARSPGGAIVASATFDDAGLGTLDLTTAPEPSSLALLATGLGGLLPAMRPKRRWLR